MGVNGLNRPNGPTSPGRLAPRNRDATIELVMQEPERASVPAVEPRDDDAYDDAQDHQQCVDCKGSGYYVGFLERSYCRSCDGSGWI